MPRLELRQAQSLVMTPKLQEAIKLLQLSNLELSEFLELELERNPFLYRLNVDEPSEADENLSDNTEQRDQIKRIVNDWADLKIKAFQDRRSWVRNPDKEKSN